MFSAKLHEFLQSRGNELWLLVGRKMVAALDDTPFELIDPIFAWIWDRIKFPSS
jgi:hypothetical protein